ncbi:MAG: transporter, partial [Paracoccaceae bacterium]
DQLSFALIFNQPYGATVEYTTPGYLLSGTSAHVYSSELAAVGRFKLNDAFSIHAGVRHITAHGDLTLVFPGAYSTTYSRDSDTGWLVGAAYEKPEIALRAALTYASATHFNMAGTLGNGSATAPQSLTLDLQSGIAADTLLFGQIRWTDWTDATIDDSIVGNVVSYTDDVVTYSVGVGRKFSDNLSGAVTLGYERSEGTPASNLAPTDGYVSLGVGGSYTMDKVKISAGVRYYQAGDATTSGIGAQFNNNHAFGAGLKVGFNF